MSNAAAAAFYKIETHNIKLRVLCACVCVCMFHPSTYSSACQLYTLTQPTNTSHTCTAVIHAVLISSESACTITDLYKQTIKMVNTTMLEQLSTLSAELFQSKISSLIGHQLVLEYKDVDLQPTQLPHHPKQKTNKQMHGNKQEYRQRNR